MTSEDYTVVHES